MVDVIKIRYSTKPRYRKYVEGYGLLSFVRKFWDKYGKKLMDSATKTRIDAVKLASERVVQNTEAAGDLDENKIADKTTSAGKAKSKEKDEANKRQEIYIPPKKDSK